jgi:DNA polymerase-3 subunit delta
MAAESFETILQSIQKKQFSPFYIFYGEEEFFIDRLSAAMEESVLAESEKAFNQNILYGKDVTSSQLIETCQKVANDGRTSIGVNSRSPVVSIQKRGR